MTSDKPIAHASEMCDRLIRHFSLVVQAAERGDHVNF